MLESTLTPAERNLVKMGEHQRLRDTRMFFQDASLREFCEPIGLSTETFVLHPRGSDAPSRAESADGGGLP